METSNVAGLLLLSRPSGAAFSAHCLTHWSTLSLENKGWESSMSALCTVAIFTSGGVEGSQSKLSRGVSIPEEHKG